jgi:hypothetical protein
VAGFYVDLAIVDPENTGRYVLGIECDGASYHASRSARDRDRLRQQVLEDRGWVIHRIWSTDWFHRPQEQLRKVVAAVDGAKMKWASRGKDSLGSGRPATETVEEVERREIEPEVGQEGSLIETVPYAEASFPMSASEEIHELPISQLATIVARIIELEGPIHQDEVARRTASLWGKRRTGGRIAEAVESALTEVTHSGQVQQHGLFFSPSGQSEVPIRNREHVQSATLRKPEYLPPEEIQATLLTVVKHHLGVDADDALVEASRLLGFRAASAQLKEVLRDELRHLIELRELDERSGKLFADSASSAAVG